MEEVGATGRHEFVYNLEVRGGQMLFVRPMDWGFDLSRCITITLKGSSTLEYFGGSCIENRFTHKS